MKKIILFLFVISVTSVIKAQDITDAVRYSNDEIYGTARFRAMGGAFGALGGDISAINLNPASSSVFNESKIGFSLGAFDKNNDTGYFNNQRSSSDNNFNLNQAGGVFVYSGGNSKWNKFSLGFAFDRTNDLNDSWVVSGVNANNSISNYFLEFAQGQRLDEISALQGESIDEAYVNIGSVFGSGNQQAFLGFEGFILDPENDTDGNTVYTSNIEGGNYNQRYALTSVGYNGKTAFNLAVEYDKRLNIGVNANVHFINYERTTIFDETNNNPASTVSSVGFDNTLSTTGVGFSFQLGSIYKVTDKFRVGLTYNSPTWYRISEETTQFLQTSVESISANPIIINPDVINVFPEYKLKTPGKITGSLAYVFSDKGLLSFDYARKDYSNTTFRPTDDLFFAAQNDIISDLLGVSNTYRIGGEYRYNQFSFRGGYRFEESPYEDESIIGNLNAYSLGLGYKFGDFSIDLAYSRGQQKRRELLFSNSNNFNESAQIDTTFTDVILSLTFGI